MKKIHLKREPNLAAKLSPFLYQAEALNAIKDLDYAAVFHEQGLGKTKIAIDLMLYWLEHTDIDTVLIATKKQLVQNWMREFKTHTYIVPAVLSSNKSDNFYVFTGAARIIVTNFEVLQVEEERFKMYLNTRNVAIIIDESAKLKNPGAKLTQTFFELSSLFKKRVIMTGTPVANRPYDIWAQIYFLDKGKSLGTDFASFKDDTDLSNKLSKSEDMQNSFEDAIASIYEKIRSFSVRETKSSGIISLPEKVYFREETEFTQQQFDLYERIRQELIIQVQQDGRVIGDDSSAIVKRMLRLVQVSSRPFLVDESFTGDSAKEKLLDRILHEIITSGEKCIVWTNFIDNVDYFQNKYAHYGSVKIHGKMKISDRNRSVERFRAKEYQVMFATPASAKEGLTLTMANHVIFYDRGFSLDDYLQAQDRIHRISQENICYVHNLIIRGSIDEWVDLLLQAKQNAAFLAQGDISLKKYKEIADYSYADIMKAVLFPEEEDKSNE
ncbi:DEAD/DEAH box helicase [Desulfitobacterium sp. AusDCA]|uniref:DEAD/DEAH box helicase n=1 Tax=Desulfitobacterium sp. AusDCA TaxID=3240383 RepID=UPI003DA70BA0